MPKSYDVLKHFIQKGGGEIINYNFFSVQGVPKRGEVGMRGGSAIWEKIPKIVFLVRLIVRGAAPSGETVKYAVQPLTYKLAYHAANHEEKSEAAKT